MAPLDAETPGWTAPVYHATLPPRQYCGVPEELFVLNALVTTLMTLTWWWPAVVVGYVVHRLARWLTTLDPYWWPILRRTLGYRLYYRG